MLIISAARTVRNVLRNCIEILWRLAEVHLSKLVLLIYVIIASRNICVLNLVVVLLISLAVSLPSLVGIISLIVAVYLSLSSIVRVVFLVSLLTLLKIHYNVVILVFLQTWYSRLEWWFKFQFMRCPVFQQWLNCCSLFEMDWLWIHWSSIWTRSYFKYFELFLLWFIN